MGLMLASLLAALSPVAAAPVADAPVRLSIWQAVILGVVEGITEYLPVSSTGHLIITTALLGLDGPETKAAMDAFNIVIQGGAILAVAGLYWSRVRSMLRGVFGHDPAGFRLLVNIGLAFLPAAVLGFLLKNVIERNLFYPGPVVAALAIGGVYMILVDLWRRHRFSAPKPSMGGKGVDDITPLDALVIGFLQCIAMWPGTSRSMMTITGGIFRGLRPAAAAEFSFLLGLPTLAAACLYSLMTDLYRAQRDGRPSMFATLGVVPVLVGLIVAAVAAALAVRWLVGFLNRKGLTPFGIYRIALSIVLLGLILGQVVRIAPDEPFAETSIPGPGVNAPPQVVPPLDWDGARP